MKKKKTIILLIVVIVLCSLVPLILYYNVANRIEKHKSEEQQEQERQQEILEQDEVAPILILTQDKITIYQGDEIDYESFIKEASDNLEGDITSRVTYEKVDTNKVGEYYIDYEVSDTANNVTKARFQVIVKEKLNFKN